MKVKQKAKRVVSGLLTAVTLLSTVLSPISSYAAELPKERKLPLLEEVQSQLDEDEIVLAKDHQVEVGTSFDVKTDFTGLEMTFDFGFASVLFKMFITFIAFNIKSIGITVETIHV